MLLRECRAECARRGFALGNVDATRDRAGAEARAACAGDARQHRAPISGCDATQCRSRRRPPSTWDSPAAAKASPRRRSCCVRYSARERRVGGDVQPASGRVTARRQRAAAVARQQVERAAVQARDALDDRKAQPRAGGAVGARRGSRARERLLQPLDLVAAECRRRGRRPRCTHRRCLRLRVVTSTGGAPYASALSIRLATQPRHRRRAQRQAAAAAPASNAHVAAAAR